MSYKPDEKNWMAYLYGEMDEAEKRKFEEYLLTDAAAAEELGRLRDLRALLSRVDDKEVIAPVLFVGDTTGNRLTNLAWRSRWFRVVASVAASLVLVILIGKVTDTRMTASEGEFKLTFGQVQPATTGGETTSLTPEEVERMISTALEQNNTRIRATLEDSQKKLDASIRSNLASNSEKIDHLVRQAAMASQEQVRQYVDAIRTENMQQVKDYFQLASTEQKQYIENLLVDYSAWLQQQRNNDLQLVQTWMNSLEQNTDIFKQETEQMITSIMTTVGTPVSGETRN